MLRKPLKKHLEVVRGDDKVILREVKTTLLSEVDTKSGIVILAVLGQRRHRNVEFARIEGCV